jgi:hypothetical protein
MHAARQWVAGILVVVAGVLFPVATVAYWANHSLLDTPRYQAAVSPLAADPAVQRAVETALRQRVASIDLGALVAKALPPALQGLGGNLQGLATQLVNQGITTFVSSQAFALAWDKVNTKAQQSLVASLNGDQSGPVTAQGTQIVLDTGVVVHQLRAQLATGALSVLADVPLPASLSTDIVLIDASQLRRLHDVYPVLGPSASWLVSAVIVAFVIAVLLAVRRWLVIAGIGVVLLLGAGAIWLFSRSAENGLSNNLSGSGLSGVAGPYWHAIGAGLTTAAIAASLLGVVLLVVGVGVTVVRRRPTAAV